MVLPTKRDHFLLPVHAPAKVGAPPPWSNLAQERGRAITYRHNPGKRVPGLDMPPPVGADTRAVSPYMQIEHDLTRPLMAQGCARRPGISLPGSHL
jgi:hypothetical protein